MILIHNMMISLILLIYITQQPPGPDKQDQQEHDKGDNILTGAGPYQFQVPSGFQRLGKGGSSPRRTKRLPVMDRLSWLNPP
jgi:hypothetical protein